MWEQHRHPRRQASPKTHDAVIWRLIRLQPGIAQAWQNIVQHQGIGYEASDITWEQSDIEGIRFELEAGYRNDFALAQYVFNAAKRRGTDPLNFCQLGSPHFAHNYDLQSSGASQCLQTSSFEISFGEDLPPRVDSLENLGSVWIIPVNIYC